MQGPFQDPKLTVVQSLTEQRVRSLRSRDRAFRASSGRRVGLALTDCFASLVLHVTG